MQYAAVQRIAPRLHLGVLGVVKVRRLPAHDMATTGYAVPRLGQVGRLGEIGEQNDQVSTVEGVLDDGLGSLLVGLVAVLGCCIVTIRCRAR